MKGLLITGFGHSGTTIMYDVLACHPDLAGMPRGGLNAVREYTPMHRCFISFMKKTQNGKPTYFDRAEFRKHLDQYVKRCHKGKTVLLKQPFYPMYCLSEYADYFGGNLTVCYVRRNKQRTIQSYVKRGQHRSFFTKENLSSQINKLPPELRAKASAMDGKSVLEMLYDYSEDMLIRCKDVCAITEVDMHKLDAKYLSGKLGEMGLSRDPAVVKRMVGLVSVGRL